MTVTTTASTTRFSSGGPDFPVPFRFLKNADITARLVLADGTTETLAEGGQYTLTGAGASNGGTLTSSYASSILAAGGARFVISRIISPTQETDLRNQGKYLAETQEVALDKLTMLSQQALAANDQVMSFPVTDPEGLRQTLPSQAARASKVAAFDAQGQPAASSLTLQQLEQQPALALASAEAAAAAAESAGLSAQQAQEAAAATDGRAGRFFGEWVQLPGRTNQPTGVVYADGQAIANAAAQYPVAVANIRSASPSVPVIAAATWLADKYSRAAWAYDVGTDTLYVPDLNGKRADSAGPVFARGDGSLGIAPGKIRQDQMQGHRHAPDTLGVGYFGTTTSSGSYALPAAGTLGRIFTRTGAPIVDGLNGEPRTGTETFPVHGVMVWGVVLFGSVSDPGAADARELATSYANQQSAITQLTNALAALDGSIGFAYLYPNGGTEAAPANVTINSRYELANPFPGHEVIVVAEIQIGGKWGETGWFYSSGGYGVKGAQLDLSTIVVQTGNVRVTYTSSATGDPFGQTNTAQTSAPCRVKVWRAKA